MFLHLANTPRDYAWGSTTAIAEFMGRTPSGAPEAELWFGAHAGSPSLVMNDGGIQESLASVIEADPRHALGADLAERRGQLPFLLKLLAANSALSLQAHPSPQQAREGFAREEAAGIPVDANFRNYRDDSAKPELVVAISESFHALSGFRPWQEVLRLLDALLGADMEMPGQGSVALLAGILKGEEPLREAVAVLLGGEQPEEVAALVTRVCALALSKDLLATEFAPSFRTVTQLEAAYPGDPGIVLSLLLNRVTLARGEALFLDAGNIHAYLNGLGIELMSSSDNVLRGGLTRKHIDVPALLSVLNFTPMEPPLLVASQGSHGVTTYDAGAADFLLHHIQGPARVSITGPAIALAQDGEVTLSGGQSQTRLARGEAVFVTPDEETIVVSGNGLIWLATTPAPRTAVL
ncbi:mannose-6-phosphate isomerase, class I [Arthrobacter psychrochitiniphilus]|uniref:mannose-6-phosphate isomerase, class I n=1 Tax=Arthrobacter psychrochitiniphilus TaxID=291045 RepID=UPI003F7BEE1E